jgi:SAM-dependent methyltransferase
MISRSLSSTFPKIANYRFQLHVPIRSLEKHMHDDQTLAARERIRELLQSRSGQPVSDQLLQQAINQISQKLVREGQIKQYSLEQVHKFWEQGTALNNQPEDYLHAPLDRSRLLYRLLRRLELENPSLLELGCNVGRNLNYLQTCGLSRLSGIEINPRAIELMAQHYPLLFDRGRIYNLPAEDVLAMFGDGEFDVVYTMAVLVHIHPDSEWIFAELARIAGRGIVLVEDEQVSSLWHFPRNYRNIFEALGFEQIHSESCAGIADLGSYTARVFTRRGGPAD